jgi:hypothetical protein
MVPATETVLGGTRLDQVTVTADGEHRTDAAGQAVYVLKGFALDGLVPQDSPVVGAWRTDPAGAFPALIWFEGSSWQCDAVIEAIEHGAGPDGYVRCHVRSTGDVTRAHP